MDQKLSFIDSKDLDNPRSTALETRQHGNRPRFSFPFRLRKLDPSSNGVTQGQTRAPKSRSSEARAQLTAVAIAGFISGAAKTFISHPLDTIKVYVQSQKQVPQSITKLYRGIEVPLLRNGVENSLHFFFRTLVATAMSGLGVPGSQNPFVVGWLSGFPQALFNTPADYIRLTRQLGQKIQPMQMFRGIGWVSLKEASGGAVFFGVYELLKMNPNIWPGFAGSIAALTAMLSTFPIDTLKTRIQAGASLYGARNMGGLSRGIEWGVAKCLASNFVALTVYEITKARTSGSSNSFKMAKNSSSTEQPLVVVKTN